MSKYAPLKADLSQRQGPRLPLSFAEVERILGFPLPPSARRHRPWWANQSDGAHTQAHAWMDAGWRVWEVDVPGERVVFVRGGKASSPSKEPTGLSDMPPAVTHLDLGRLSQAGLRLINDYAREMDGDMEAALARAVHDAAMARRGRLVRQWVASAPRVPPGERDSAALVREDRDAR